MLRMKPNSQIKDHLDTFSKLVSDLADMGLSLADEILAVLLLCTLTDEYSMLTKSLMYGKEKITLEEVESRCIQKVSWRKYRRKRLAKVRL